MSYQRDPYKEADYAAARLLWGFIGLLTYPLTVLTRAYGYVLRGEKVEAIHE